MLLEQRNWERFPVLVPAAIDVGGRLFTARALNISCAGVMVETAAPLLPGTSITFRSGAIECEAAVVWADNGRAGAKFSTAQPDPHVDQQVVRTAAIKAWRCKHRPATT